MEFAVFFTAVCALYFIIPSTYRWLFLLVASYYFYMNWKAESVIILLAYTLINYYCGIKIHEAMTLTSKKLYLGISVVASVGMLFFFKYFNFFNDSLREILRHYSIFYGISNLDILLPIGISFYTFKSISYIIDIFRGHREPERHFGFFALYVSFFPQILAGPIDRATNLLPQMHQRPRFDYEKFTSGLQLMLWGFFKKIVIADRLAILVNHVYDNPADFSGMSLLVATYCFAFQLYYDFSGYSDIAIGATRVLGFQSVINFKRPYYSQTVSEFWRRWHISLSSWFNDYVFTPLTFMKREWAIFSVILAAIATFALSGLWHGAAWTYVAWGTLHGFAVSFDAVTKKQRKNLQKSIPEAIFKPLSIFLTFNFVCLSFIFFRANTLSDGLYIITHIFNGIGMTDLRAAAELAFLPGLGGVMLAVVLLSSVVVETAEVSLERGIMPKLFLIKNAFFRWAASYALIFAVIIFGVFKDAQEFIYFKF